MRFMSSEEMRKRGMKPTGKNIYRDVKEVPVKATLRRFARTFSEFNDLCLEMFERFDEKLEKPEYWEFEIISRDIDSRILKMRATPHYQAGEAKSGEAKRVLIGD